MSRCPSSTHFRPWSTRRWSSTFRGGGHDPWQVSTEGVTCNQHTRRWNYTSLRQNTSHAGFKVPLFTRFVPPTREFEAGCGETPQRNLIIPKVFNSITSGNPVYPSGSLAHSSISVTDCNPRPARNHPVYKWLHPISTWFRNNKLAPVSIKLIIPLQNAAPQSLHLGRGS